MNRNHYASWIVHLGGESLITGVADVLACILIHLFLTRTRCSNTVLFERMILFRTFWNGRGLPEWPSAKTMNVIVDNLEIEKLNAVNLKAVTSAALILLPSKFSEEELYAKICSLSYMGDLRMLFAEDKNKVKKIVQGQFHLFQRMYNPLLEEFATRDLFRMSSSDKKNNPSCRSSCTKSST
ncbi:hypothetical protein CASFOL_039042 [Castilleja foliolosa]|uniref:Phosphatidate cytidylyltransferase, mitochondrial n=1 Tax=Castilleja foliolosa TaxID=1961234 RepID=A0ABD3BGX1_9LAMI